MIGKIIGSGKYAPEKVLTNADLEKIVDTSDEWIFSRTGMKNRHIVEEDTTSTMSAKAAAKAIEDAGIDPLDIDMIVVASVTPDSLVPNLSCIVQLEVGAKNAICMDVNTACVGFLMGFQIAQTYIKAGEIKTALVIGADTLSAITNYEDRSNCILFGDGAGAVILKAEEGKVASVMHMDAERGHFLTAKTRTRHDWKEVEENKEAFMSMDGQDVFKFATREVPKAILDVLEIADEKLEDIDFFVMHQANGRILDFLAKRLKVDPSKIPSNVAEYGNTSSASVPLIMDDMFKDGTLKPEQKIIITAFGGGLSWGATYIEI